MTDIQQSVVQLLEFLRESHRSCTIPDSWCYDGPADLLLREAEWFDATRAEVIPWEQSEVKACFRNAAMYAMLHPGLRYIEGYSVSLIPVHHAWCVDCEDRILELTWKKAGAAYFGVEFNPRLVMRGSVLFHPPNERIYKRRLKTKKNLKGVISSC